MLNAIYLRSLLLYKKMVFKILYIKRRFKAKPRWRITKCGEGRYSLEEWNGFLGMYFCKVTQLTSDESDSLREKLNLQ